MLIIDAAHLGETPGARRWLELDEVDGLSASTHTLPPTVLGQFLQTELGAKVSLLAIQPEQLEFGAPPSAAMSNVACAPSGPNTYACASASSERPKRFSSRQPTSPAAKLL